MTSTTAEHRHCSNYVSIPRGLRMLIYLVSIQLLFLCLSYPFWQKGQRHLTVTMRHQRSKIDPEKQLLHQVDENHGKEKSVPFRKEIRKRPNVKMQKSVNPPPQTDEVESHGDVDEPVAVLLRSIGNSLPPRHVANQSLINTRFILEHELNFTHVHKHWVLNRIVDPVIEKALIGLLLEYKQNYTVIPFELKEYAKVPFVFEGYGQVDIIHTQYFTQQMIAPQRQLIVDAIFDKKNIYATNINGMRNTMLKIGMGYLDAKWILPWDGNCFLTPTAWESIREELKKNGKKHKYMITPMDRVEQSNEELLQSDYQPNAIEEPQIIFRRDAKGRFDERLRYGRRNKVGMLMQMGVKGPWDHWVWEKWEKDSDPKQNMLQDVTQPVPKAGWVARLYSGNKAMELKGAMEQRGLTRSAAMIDHLEHLDIRVAQELHGFTEETLLFYDENILAREKEVFQSKSNDSIVPLIHQLIDKAKEAIEHGPWSVMNKTEVPPSNSKHDYYHPAPYFWPNPNSKDGLPYVLRDGQRVPGTQLYDDQSTRFDRSSVAAFKYNTTCLALAWYFTGQAEYAVKAADNIRAWFLNEETKMNPNLKYAQVALGHNGNNGIPSGLIEMKDLYFFLDAVRLIRRSGQLTLNEYDRLKLWFKEYANWAHQSSQGLQEYIATNNHGLYYDIQLVSVHAFVGDLKSANRLAQDAASRLTRHITKGGKMPLELTRPNCEHYQLFTLQGWVTLARLVAKLGVNLWTHMDSHHKTQSTLCRAAYYSVPYLNHRPVCAHNIHAENIQRWWPILYETLQHCPSPSMPGKVAEQEQKQSHQPSSWLSSVSWIPSDAKHLPLEPVPESIYAMEPHYFEHDGIGIFWNLGVNGSGIPSIPSSSSLNHSASSFSSLPQLPE